MLRRPQGSYAKRAHGAAGWLLNQVEDLAFLVSVSDARFPVVGASPSFCSLVGASLQELLGKGAEEVMTGGAPPETVSRAANKNLTDFCYVCREASYENVSETTVVQPLASKGDGYKTMLSLMGLCEVRRRPYVLVVQGKLADGLMVRTTAAARDELTEQCREAFQRIRRQICGKSLFASTGSHLGSECGSESGLSASETESISPKSVSRAARLKSKREHFAARGHRRESVLSVPSKGLPPFGFYRDRLQDHCILSNDGFTATRREMEELPTGCLVFSDRAVPTTARGLEFSMRIDAVVDKFEGLPLMGFTRRRPVDQPDLYPVVSTCQGRSILIGRGEKAYARDLEPHFQMGFRAPPQTEVETFSAPAGANSDVKSRRLLPGDVVSVTYAWDGGLRLFLNQKLVLDFDTKRPIDSGEQYYAVVDVCLSVGSCTLLPPKVEEAPSAASGVATTLSMKHPLSQQLFTDLTGPLAPLMSVGELSTMELDACGSRGASTTHSLSSLPSVNTEDEDSIERSVDKSMAQACSSNSGVAAAASGSAHAADVAGGLAVGATPVMEAPRRFAPALAAEDAGHLEEVDHDDQGGSESACWPARRTSRVRLTWERLAQHDADHSGTACPSSTGSAVHSLSSDTPRKIDTDATARPSGDSGYRMAASCAVVALTAAIGVLLLRNLRASTH